MSEFVIGIDGGGTSCRAAVAEAGGRILGRGKSGAANILTDPDGAIVSIIECTRAAFADAGLPRGKLSASSAVLGLAGANVGEAGRYVSEHLPFAASNVVPDGLIALQGALGDRDGAVAILGTGSVFMSRNGASIRSIGGWGSIVGDLGGGARLGRALLEETLLAHDHIHRSSPVTDAVMTEFKGEPGYLVEFARTAKPSDFGRFAPLVFDHAGKDDTVAIKLIETAARSVDEALDAITSSGCERLSLLGGLSHLYPQWLSDRHRAILFDAEADALTGAVALAAARFGTRIEVSA